MSISNDYVLLDQTETSAITRAPVNTLKDWRAKGDKGPLSGVVGGRVIYRKSDVLAWIDAEFASSVKGCATGNRRTSGFEFRPLGKRSLAAA